MVDPIIRIVVTAIILISAAMFAMVIYLSLRKWLGNRHARIVDAYRKRLRLPMQRYLLQGGRISKTLLPNDNRLKFVALELLLFHFSGFLSSVEVHDRIRSYAEATFAIQYRKWLKSRGWGRRMNVLFHIEQFGLRLFEKDLLLLLESNRGVIPAETELIYRILAGFGSEGFIPLLLREKTHLSDLACRNIFARIPEQQLPLFIDLFPSLTPQLQYALIDVIGIRRREMYVDFLESLLSEQEAELRIRALKALSEMPMLLPKDYYLNHAAADHWQERVMAAKLLGAIRISRFLPSLETMLSDRSWWVRQQAGQSILNFREGRRILTRVKNESPDRFAREVAAEALEKGEAGNADY
jgi:hypothetical protein